MHRLVNGQRVELSNEEVDALEQEWATNAEKAVDRKALEKAHRYLKDTDHKFLSDYISKPGEDLDLIKSKRATHRNYIREKRKLKEPK